jgi:hypothetical protein
MGELMEALEQLGQRQQQSGASGEPSMALAAAPREAGFRSSGTSLPPAGRSVMVQPRSRAAGLMLALLGVLALAGVSLWRLQAPDERHAARSAGAEAPAELLPPPSARDLPAPIALDAESSSASALVSAKNAPPSGDAAPPDEATPAAEAAPSAEATPSSVEALAPGKPVSIVELTDGKRVEIEARTRRSLRLSRDPPATVPAPRSSPRRARKAAAGAHAKERTEHASERAPSELMNPWPTPAIGPARD